MKSIDEEYLEWYEWDQHNEQSWHAAGLAEIDSFYDVSDALDTGRFAIDPTLEQDSETSFPELDTTSTSKQQTQASAAMSPDIQIDIGETRRETFADDDPRKADNDEESDPKSDNHVELLVVQPEICNLPPRRDLEAAQTLLSIPHAATQPKVPEYEFVGQPSKDNSNDNPVDDGEDDHGGDGADDEGEDEDDDEDEEDKDDKDDDAADSAVAIGFDSVRSSPVAPAFEPLSPRLLTPLGQHPMDSDAVAHERESDTSTPPTHISENRPQCYSPAPMVDPLKYGPGPPSSLATGRKLFLEEMNKEDTADEEWQRQETRPLTEVPRFLLSIPKRYPKPEEPFNDIDNPSIPLAQPLVRISHEGRKSLAVTTLPASSTPSQHRNIPGTTSYIHEPNNATKSQASGRVKAPRSLAAVEVVSFRKSTRTTQDLEQASRGFDTDSHRETRPKSDTPNWITQAEELHSRHDKVVQEIKDRKASGDALGPTEPVEQFPRKRKLDTATVESKRVKTATYDESATTVEVAVTTAPVAAVVKSIEPLGSTAIEPSKEDEHSSSLSSLDTASAESLLTGLDSDMVTTPIPAQQPTPKATNFDKKKPDGKPLAKPTFAIPPGTKRHAVSARELGGMLGVMGDEGLKQSLVSLGGSPRATRNFRRTRGMVREEADEMAKEVEDAEGWEDTTETEASTTKTATTKAATTKKRRADTSGAINAHKTKKAKTKK